ncbi:flavin reductase [Mucilaginibacter sp. X5P1]|uniref:flavin reductase n=1 Tax=Mucilaginibacter sp. X5P1 TaxID=2723088 RepID=UPI0016187315|nr:flavin reductase [Mucilaginibacter sp. X5P1]MBB6139248.1 flavin reductase (DIM6/NTAB) family NADH-FMN oxidoreductase RutF [Mucilaginibacter sp. X5P1]
MNGLLTRLLLGDSVVQEYQTVTVNREITEKVWLKVNGSLFDISTNQFLLCLEPIVFGIWLNKSKAFLAGDSFKLCFTPATENGIRRNVFAVSKLDFLDSIETENGTLFLFKQLKTIIRHINTVKTHFLFYKHYKKPGFTLLQLKALAAAYSYPRRVRIVSFKQGDYYNIFPMDLLGDLYQDDCYLFGLRNTNKALIRILDEKKLVVCEVPGDCKQLIYQLGSHHSKTPPEVDQLPFEVTKSKIFNFFVPDWACSYKEVEIIKSINMGSHTLLFGKVVNIDVLKTLPNNLYHIHYLLQLYHKRKGYSYQSV